MLLLFKFRNKFASVLKLIICNDRPGDLHFTWEGGSNLHKHTNVFNHFVRPTRSFPPCKTYIHNPPKYI